MRGIDNVTRERRISQSAHCDLILYPLTIADWQVRITPSTTHFGAAVCWAMTSGLLGKRTRLGAHTLRGASHGSQVPLMVASESQLVSLKETLNYG